jgi:CubicO group peptidase (beta-lactamase class C family)
MRFRLMVATALCAALPGFAQPNLDAVVERTREAFHVPGIAVGIVKDGQLIFAKGFGVRKLGEPAPVTPRTLFGIASNTKAFTAASLAMLVDEGKVKWDDPVINYLPWFRLSDPYVTNEMKVRDLLVHRSGLGLGAGDLMFFPTSDLTSDEIVRRLRFVPLATSFRSTYAYDNVLYLVAGKVIEEVSGKSWDAFIRERIFQPLGMTGSYPLSNQIPAGADVASPHAPEEGRLQVLPITDLNNNAPAGAIQSSIEDMAKWVTVQLNRGEIAKRKRLFGEMQSREMWSPQTIMPAGTPTGPLATVAPNFVAYGLGWVVSDYRGHKMVHHTGGLAGMVTRVTLIPDSKLGVIVLTNQESGGAFNAITYTVLDQYLAPGVTTDWVQALLDAQKKREADAAKVTGEAGAKRNASSRPSLPVPAYAGRYRDAWYGDVLIEEKDGTLGIRFTHSPSLTGKLEHWQYDTFVARWNDRTLLADAYVTFWLNPDGKIAEVHMKAVSPLTDFSYDFHHLLLKPVAKDAKPY